MDPFHIVFLLSCAVAIISPSFSHSIGPASPLSLNPGPINTNGKNYSKIYDPARFADMKLDMDDFQYCDKSLPYELRVKDLIGRMALAKKVGSDRSATRPKASSGSLYPRTTGGPRPSMALALGLPPSTEALPLEQPAPNPHLPLATFSLSLQLFSLESLQRAGRLPVLAILEARRVTPGSPPSATLSLPRWHPLRPLSLLGPRISFCRPRSRLRLPCSRSKLKG